VLVVAVWELFFGKDSRDTHKTDSCNLHTHSNNYHHHHVKRSERDFSKYFPSLLADQNIIKAFFSHDGRCRRGGLIEEIVGIWLALGFKGI
jgi:hypothetical protein